MAEGATSIPRKTARFEACLAWRVFDSGGAGRHEA